MIADGYAIPRRIYHMFSPATAFFEGNCPKKSTGDMLYFQLGRSILFFLLLFEYTHCTDATIVAKFQQISFL